MVQTIEETTGVCPLCANDIGLDVPDWRISAKWRDAFEYRDKWLALARSFRELESVERAAEALGVPTEDARLVLEFLSIELCGCRAVTCVSCLDDYRSDL